MPVIERIDRLVARWRAQRSRRRTEMLITALPPDLQRDIGWPAVDPFPATRTR